MSGQLFEGDQNDNQSTDLSRFLPKLALRIPPYLRNIEISRPFPLAKIDTSGFIVAMKTQGSQNSKIIIQNYLIFFLLPANQIPKHHGLMQK